MLEETEAKLTVYDDESMWDHERTLKGYGYEKIADCFWAKIFQKGTHRVILTRK